MVITIYLDAKNPEWSTKELLDQLQNGGFGPFYCSGTNTHLKLKGALQVKVKHEARYQHRCETHRN